MTLEITPAPATETRAQAVVEIANSGGPASPTAPAWKTQAVNTTGTIATSPTTTVRAGGLGTKTARAIWACVTPRSITHSRPGIWPGHRITGSAAVAPTSTGKPTSSAARVWRERRPRRHPSHIAP